MIGSPGMIVVPQRKPGEKAISRVLFRDQGVEDQLVETAVEIAAPVQQAFAYRQSFAELALVGRAGPCDQRRHFRVGGQEIGEDRKQPVAEIGDMAVL